VRVQRGLYLFPDYQRFLKSQAVDPHSCSFHELWRKLLLLRWAVTATFPIYSMFSEIHKMVSRRRELGPVQSCQNTKMNISVRSCVLLCIIYLILESHGHRPGALSCLVSFSSEESRTLKDSNCKVTRPFPWFESSDEGVFVAFCCVFTFPPSDRKRYTWVEVLAEACCGKELLHNKLQ